MFLQFGLLAALLTQRVRWQRAGACIRTSAERYKNVVEAHSDLICGFLPDTTLTFVNDAYCRFWKRPRQELLGTKFIELTPGSARDDVLKHISRAASHAISHEYPVVLPDGTIGWHHRIIHAMVNPSTGLVEFQGVGRDITDRKRADDALRQAEAQNAAILRAIPDLMFVVRRDGTYVGYHAQDPRLLFSPPEQFLGKRIADVMPAELAAKFMRAIARVGRDGEPVVVKYALEMDRLRHYEARLVSAGPDAVLSIVRDVTESVRAVAENRHLAGRLIASQELERLRVARELHDGLGQKVALLNIEIDQLADDVESAPQRSTLQALSMRVAEIATELHNLSHGLHPSRLQALGLVGAIDALCRDMMCRAKLAIAFKHDRSYEDSDHDVALCLYRVTQEALHNIVRHGQVREATVSLGGDVDHLYLEVADKGVGFDPEAVEHKGLGLASIRERVEYLEGQLDVRTARGRGTHIGVRIRRTPSVQRSSLVSKSA